MGQGFSTPFLSVGPTYSYLGYDDAKRALGEVGRQIREGGLPPEVSPLVATICGTGNVSKGAVDALSALGDATVQWVTPEELPRLSELHGTPGPHQRRVYACVVGTEHFVAHGTAPHAPFDRSHYYAEPHEYVPTFHETIAPHTSLLVPTMYWDRRFPRLLTVDQLAELRARGNSRLLAVADLTCDVGGAVESLVRTSTVDAPYYVYDVEARAERSDGLDGPGVLMMGVDILPSELPKEASQHFGDLLFPFVEPLTSPGTKLPPELAGATIADEGALQPAYKYIAAMRVAQERSQEVAAAEERAAAEQRAAAARKLSAAELSALRGSTVLSLHGHLFDSGLINAALDLIEQAGGRFDLIEINVRPNPTASGDRLSLRTKSAALLQLTLDEGRPALDEVLARLQALLQRMPLAEASFHELPDYCGGVYDRTIASDEKPSSAPTQATKPVAAAALAAAVRVAPAAVTAGRSMLVLGAGLCAGPAVEMLSRDPSATVHVVSAVSGEAEALCASLGASRPNCVPHAVDVTAGAAMLRPMVREAGAVLSLLPATMHAAVAQQCIAEGTPLVTASYVASELAALHEEARAKGVPLLCEMGLDPGLDHMSAAAMIAQVHRDGGEVRSFSSLCGGLPAPECAFNGNPFGYKFSWSPMGVIVAMRNAAQWREQGRAVRVQGDELLRAAKPLIGGLLGRAFSLEVLPNRDALPYASLYGIEAQAETFFRGTLRYAGWSELMSGLAAFGLAQPTPMPVRVNNWPQLLDSLGVPHPTASGIGANSESARAVDALLWLGAWDEGTAVAGGTVAAAPSNHQPAV